MYHTATHLHNKALGHYREMAWLPFQKHSKSFYAMSMTSRASRVIILGAVHKLYNAKMVGMGFALLLWLRHKGVM